MTSDQELLRKELTILATEQPNDFIRLIRTMKNLGIDGTNFAFCAYGTLANTSRHKNIEHRKDRGDASADRMRHRLGDVFVTPLEDSVIEMFPGKPLNEEQQALITLCEEILQSCSPAATGSKQ
jgi:hypothetical protein